MYFSIHISTLISLSSIAWRESHNPVYMHALVCALMTRKIISRNGKESPVVNKKCFFICRLQLATTTTTVDQLQTWTHFCDQSPEAFKSQCHWPGVWVWRLFHRGRLFFTYCFTLTPVRPVHILLTIGDKVFVCLDDTINILGLCIERRMKGKEAEVGD